MTDRNSEILQGEALDMLDSIEDDSVDLVFADPPFNIGKNYDGYEDDMSDSEYYEWTMEWVNECKRVLKENGSIYIAIGDRYAAEMKQIMESVEYDWRNWIIWYYNFGQHMQKKFSRCHTHIHYYVVDDDKDFTFNADEIRVPSARQKKYNDKRANPEGKVPPDVWEVPRLQGNNNERLDHPCQMPEKILERIIKASSNEGDIVLDPFAGSGTTCAMAKKLGRYYIGVEQSEKYCEMIEERLKDIDFGEENG